MDAIERGWALLAAARWDKAIATFDRVLARSSGRTVRAHVGRAVALRLVGRVDEALDDLNAAVALDPQDALAYHERGATLASLGRDGEALRDLDRAIGIAPSAKALTDRGGVHSELGRHAEAIADLRRAIELQPDLAEAHHNLGTTFARAGDLRSAAHCFQRAVRLGFEPAAAPLLRARQELFVAANDDGSWSLAVEAVLDARSIADLEEALERFPFMALPEFLDSLQNRERLLPGPAAGAMRQRTEALRSLSRP